MEVVHAEDTVVDIGASLESAETNGGSFCKGVRDHAVAGLECHLWLEGVGGNSTHHLKRNIRAVEDTCIVWAAALVTRADKVAATGCSGVDVWINVNLDLAVEGTSKGIASVINIKSGVKSR